MSSILFALLWVIISIAFITTLVITVVKYAKEKQYSSYLVSTILPVSYTHLTLPTICSV